MTLPPALPNPQAFQDAEHLKLLSVAHYILGGLTGLFACIPFIHVFMGIMIIAGKIPGGMTLSSSAAMTPSMMGWLFVGFGSIFILLGWAMAVSMLLAGRWLSARKHRTFCLVIAGIECLNFPLGTILGVFTLVVLQRPSVQSLFTSPEAQPVWGHPGGR